MRNFWRQVWMIWQGLENGRRGLKRMRVDDREFLRRLTKIQFEKLKKKGLSIQVTAT